ncbi:MAG: hemolysin family protein [Christensenellales bacterium]
MKSDPDLYGHFIILFINLILLGLFQSFTTALDSTSQSRLKKFTDENERYLKRLDFTINLLERPLKYQFSIKLFSLLIFSYSIFILWKIPYDFILLVILWLILVVTFSILLSSKFALLHSEKIAIKCCYFVYGLHIISLPLFWISKTIVNIILILFKEDIDIENKFFSEDEVMSMLEVGRESGIIKEEGRKMISSIFNFDDELAYEIMTPRTDVFAIDILEPTSEYIDKLMELRYSRIPVYEDDYDNIIGILNIKDYLIKARETGFDKVDIRGILREPYFVPETKNIDSLFFELQKTKNHIAILIDEYGGFSGIVTMEDIVEEIVGDIDDEYDEDAHIVNKIDENTFLIDGNVSLDDLEEDYGIVLESDSSETIGGFIIDHLGEIPTESDLGKEVDFGNYKITITSVKERRIDKVKLVVTETKEDAEDEECGE